MVLLHAFYPMIEVKLSSGIMHENSFCHRIYQCYLAY